MAYPPAASPLVRCVLGSRRTRALTGAERAHLQRLFGTVRGDACSLDLDKLRIAGGGHPLDRATAWQPFGGFMQFRDTCFVDRACTNELRPELFPILAHEAFHVWQRRHRKGRNVSLEGLWLGVFVGRRAYDYDASTRDPEGVLRQFTSDSTNIEAQARMFEDFSRSPDDPKWSLVAAYVREPARPPQLAPSKRG